MEQMGHAQRHTFRQKVESFDAGEAHSTVGEARRGVTPCNAQRGDSVQEEGGVADLMEARA